MKFFNKIQQLHSTDPGFIVRLVCTCWIITKLLCYKLWLAYRFFPLVPVHDALHVIPPVIHLLLLCISLTGMAGFVFFPSKKMGWVILIAEVLACLLDQNRWQPWEYQFLCMLGAYLFIENENKKQFCWQAILVGLYFFSGLNKCDHHFIYNVWNNLLLKNLAGIAQPGTWLLRAGYCIPMIEMFAAIALCFGRSRNLAAWLLVLMHIFNLLVFGPLGLRTNEVIWPWNLLMPILVISLFYKKNAGHFTLPLMKPIYTIIILIAWWALPWLQLAGYWDKYLSGVLYSGRVEYLYICTDDLNAHYRLSGCFTKSQEKMECITALSVYQWGMQEMNSAPYPEKRVYRSIAADFNKLYPKAVNHFYLYRGGFSKKITEFPIRN